MRIAPDYVLAIDLALTRSKVISFYGEIVSTCPQSGFETDPLPSDSDPLPRRGFSGMY